MPTESFFTNEERAEPDRQLSGILARDSTESRRARGTESDVNGELNQAVFTTHLHVGKRTSLIVDDPRRLRLFGGGLQGVDEEGGLPKDRC